MAFLVAPQAAPWRCSRREPLRRTSSSQSQMLARAAAGAAMEASSSSSSGSARNAVSRKAGRLWTGVRQGARSLWEDSQEWGFGAEPIFTVVVSSDGRLRVEVDEEEICGRCSLQPMVSRRRIAAAERIAKARKLAADIENGLVQPPPTSLVFRYVKDGAPKQTTLVGDAKVFLQQKGGTVGNGLLLGLSIALASFFVLQMRSLLKKQQVVDEQSAPPKSPPSSRPVHNTERLLAIRGMARQAMDEEAAGELEEMDESMQYGAAMRAKIAKKPTKEQASNDPERTRFEGASPSTIVAPVAQTAETEVRPRIILSTKEAAELLAERRRRSLQKQPALTVPGEDISGAAKAEVQSTAPASHNSYELEEKPLASSSASGRQQEDMKQDHFDQFALEHKQEDSGSQITENVFMDTFEQVTQELEHREHSGASQESLEQKLGLQANENVSTGDSQKPLGSLEEQHLEQQQQETSPERGQDEQSPLQEAQKEGRSMEQTAAPETIPVELKLRNGSFEAAESSPVLIHNGPTEKSANSSVKVESADRGLISGWSSDEEAAMSRESSTTNQAVEFAHCLNDVPAENLANSSEDRELTVSAPNSAVAASAVKEFLSKGRRQSNESGEKLSRTVVASNADLPINEEPKNPKKVWPKELQRRYERETDPKMRALMKEIGKDLKEWVPEEKVEEAVSLFYKGPDGQRELIRRWEQDIARQKGRNVTEPEEKQMEKQMEKMLKRCAKIEERMQNWTNRFGPLALRNKYRDYIPPKPDYYWWFDLRYVACLDVRNEKHSAHGGLYSMDMADEVKQQKGRVHVIGFEEQHDALNFSRILVPEMDELYGETDVAIIPFEPKELFREAAAAGYRVTVIKKGELEMFAGQPLYEVEDKMRFIGRDYYLQEEIRARSIDISAVMEDIGRGL